MPRINMWTDRQDKCEQAGNAGCFAISRPARYPITQMASSFAEEANDSWQRWIESDPVVTTRGGGGGGRVLFIAYQFPPVGGSGVQRPAKLVKFLHTAGFDIEVLTAAHLRVPWIDPTLNRDIPPCVRVHRVAGYEPACMAERVASALAGCWNRVFANARFPKQWLEDRIYWRLARWAARAGLGNGEPLWLGSAARAAVAMHRRRPFDVIVSTGPPYFVHRVALRVSAETRLPWVADVRDPIVSDYDFGQPDVGYRTTMRRVERMILGRASRIVTTSAALADDFRARYPDREASDIRTITNGFDRDDLRREAAAFVRGATWHSNAERRCTFVAAGAFNGRNELARLVDPMRDVLTRHPQWRGRVRLIVAGKLDGRQERHWQRHRPEWMELRGYVDHGQAVELVARSDAAVLMLPDCSHSRHCIPGKTFELIALPAHVLALVPSRSETEGIVARAGAATIAPLEDPARVETAVESVIARCLSGTLPRERTWSNLDRYDRRQLAADFGRCLHDAIRHG